MEETVLAVCAPALLPLLATPERLSVSASSTALLHAYRGQARTLVLRPTAVVEVDEECDEEWQAQHESPHQLPPEHEQRQPQAAHDPVATLLARQRCLGRLVVGDARAVPGTAAAAAAPGLRRLTALVLEELGTDAAAVVGVARALEGGAMPCLEVLKVRESARPDDRTLPILAALRRGACPALRRLLLGSRLGLPALTALAEALEARYNNHSHHHHHNHQQQLASLTLSIGAQGFPSPAACAGAVARVVGACRESLEELSVEGFGPIAEGVCYGLGGRETGTEAGASPTPAVKGAPGLRRLRCALVLFEAQEHGAGSVLLARGLAEGGVAPALEALDLSGLLLTGPAFAALVGGVASHLAGLRELRLASAGLTTGDMEVLEGAWARDPAPWRRLRWLDLGGNRGVRSQGVAVLARQLGPGRALEGLEELALERCCRGDAGAVALFQALCREPRQPAGSSISDGDDDKLQPQGGPPCWRLRTLHLGGCGLGPEAMAGLRAALSAEGGGARGAWAQSLAWLALPKNPLHGGHLDLAAALAAAGPGLALERLDVWSTGMSKAGAMAWAGALARVGAVVAPRLVAMDVDNQYPRLDGEAEAALRGALRARRRALQRKGEGCTVWDRVLQKRGTSNQPPITVNSALYIHKCPRGRTEK